MVQQLSAPGLQHLHLTAVCRQNSHNPGLYLLHPHAVLASAACWLNFKPHALPRTPVLGLRRQPHQSAGGGSAEALLASEAEGHLYNTAPAIQSPGVYALQP